MVKEIFFKIKKIRPVAPKIWGLGVEIWGVKIFVVSLFSTTVGLFIACQAKNVQNEFAGNQQTTFQLSNFMDTNFYFPLQSFLPVFYFGHYFPLPYYIAVSD